MLRLSDRDWNMRFVGGYITKEVDGVKIPLKVLAVEEPNLIVEASYLDRNTFERESVRTNNTSLCFKKPEMGAVNTEGSVLYMQPSIQRQWKDPLIEELVRFVDPFKDERAAAAGENWMVGGKQVSGGYRGLRNIGLLHSIFNRKYFNPQEAVGSIISGRRLAAAFDKNWFFGINMRRDEINLWRKLNKVGVWNTHSNSVHIHEDVRFLREELNLFGVNVEVG